MGADRRQPAVAGAGPGYGLGPCTHAFPVLDGERDHRPVADTALPDSRWQPTRLATAAFVWRPVQSGLLHRSLRSVHLHPRLSAVRAVSQAKPGCADTGKTGLFNSGYRAGAAGHVPQPRHTVFQRPAERRGAKHANRYGHDGTLQPHRDSAPGPAGQRLPAHPAAQSCDRRHPAVGNQDHHGHSQRTQD